MLLAELISVGTELLMGEIVDSNAAYLAQELKNRGVFIQWKTIVGDNLDRIVEAIARASKRSDIVILGGGLGPTDDDLTREGIAAVVGETPVIDEVYLPFAPSEATGFGFHAYDGRLEDLSATAVRAQVQRLKRFRTELTAVNRSALSKAARIDAELLLSNVDAQLFALTKVRAWARDPDVYTSLASRAVFVIMSRAFAPAEARLRSVIAREEQMPRLFEAARANLPAARPPRIFCEIAASQLPGIVRFFEKDVPAAFTQVRDEALLAHFRKANTAVIARVPACWPRRDNRTRTSPVCR